MPRGTVRASLSLGLSLLLFSCGQPAAPGPSSEAPVPADAVTSTAPAGTGGALSLTPGENSLSFEAALYARNGYGPAEVNQSNGGKAAGDGKTLTLNGKTYARGFGTHANSELRFSLKGQGAQCARFTSDLGVDDEVGAKGSVVFQVFLDGVKAFDSGKLTGKSATRQLDLNIGGKNELKLVVTDAGDGIDSDHADWAAPKIFCEPGEAPSGSVDARFKAVRPDFDVVDGAVQPDGKLVVFGTGAPLVEDDVARFVFARYNVDGSPDTSFGTNGEVALTVGSANTAYQVAVGADGKIVAAGYSRFPREVNGAQVGVALLRLLPGGQPDASFGDGGVAFAGGALRGFDDFAVQPDGKVVVVEGGGDFSAVRFDANGDLDAGFGKNGRATTVSAGGAAQAVAVQADGKIVVGGQKFRGAPGTPEAEYSDRLFARLNPNGSPDTSFGSGGQVSAGEGRLGGHVDDLAAGQGGAVLYAGQGFLLPSCTVGKLSANGAPDGSFAFKGLGGVTGTTANSMRLAVQSDAKIVVAGCDADNASGNGIPALFRLGTDGAVDTSFGQGDFIRAQDNRDANIQPDGKILVGLNPVARLLP